MNISVFGTHQCPNCTNVKSYLDDNRISYSYQTVGKDIEKSELDEMTGRNIRSVPIIMVDGIETAFDTLKTSISSVSILSDLEL